MVNVDRLKTLREFLAKHEDRFDYGTFCSELGLKSFGDMLHTCGTVACVGGWALALFCPHMSSAYSFEGAACDSLGLNRDQRDFLFYGDEKFGFPVLDLDTATIQDALDRIDFLIKEAV